jgi:branched-subunit amino acid transport protein
MMQLVCYIAIMALVTYAIRAIPFVAFRKKINSRFVQDFLYYVPYAVLSAMTIPAVLYATEHMASAAVGAVVAVVLAFFRRGLLTVALSACGAALAAELVIRYLL